MSSRVLNSLNSIGCLALGGVITLQWLKERTLQSQLTNVIEERDTTHAAVLTLETRCSTLDRDVITLKESISATQMAAEQVGHQLTAKTTDAAQLQTDIDTARLQLTTWETAVKERDNRIEELNSNLTKTRARLDEAIVRIKPL